jgi:hypothetical protein
MSNEVGRVKSDSARFLIFVQTPVQARGRNLRGEHLARGLRSVLCSNLIARSVSLHLCGAAHQTCLRSATTMGAGDRRGVF